MALEEKPLGADEYSPDRNLKWEIVAATSRIGWMIGLKWSGIDEQAHVNLRSSVFVYAWCQKVWLHPRTVLMNH